MQLGELGAFEKFKWTAEFLSLPVYSVTSGKILSLTSCGFLPFCFTNLRKTYRGYCFILVLKTWQGQVQYFAKIKRTESQCPCISGLAGVFGNDTAQKTLHSFIGLDKIPWAFTNMVCSRAFQKPSFLRRRKS